MPNIIEIADKDTLLALKTELAEKMANPKDVLKKYEIQYKSKNYDEYTCNVSFGYGKNITDFKKNIEIIKPYSNIQSFPKVREARGSWQVMYNIAFISGETITVNTKIKKEKVKELTKEAA